MVPSGVHTTTWATPPSMKKPTSSAVYWVPFTSVRVELRATVLSKATHTAAPMSDRAILRILKATHPFANVMGRVANRFCLLAWLTFNTRIIAMKVGARAPRSPPSGETSADEGLIIHNTNYSWAMLRLCRTELRLTRAMCTCIIGDASLEVSFSWGWPDVQNPGEAPSCPGGSPPRR